LTALTCRILPYFAFSVTESQIIKETLNKSVYAHAKGTVEQFSKETGHEAEYKAPKLTLCCGRLMRFYEKGRTPLPGSSQAAASVR